MAYSYKYYTPYTEQQKKRAFKKRLTRWKKYMLAALCAVAGLCAAAITASQLVGGPLPTWREIYALCAAPPAVSAESEVPDAATRIHFIDMGQADATLIEQDGEFCLIDAGGMGSKQALLDYLDAAGVKNIKLLVMTHEHADHIGAMAAVLEHYNVERVLLPDFSNSEAPNGYTILRTLELIDVQGVPDVTAKQGDTYAIGSGTLTVLSSGIPTNEKNNTSVITMFTAGSFRYLSCGDAQEEETSVLLESGADVHADVYKAAHHGASDANSISWLRAVAPQCVIVSCGRDNTFGHPHKSALDAFAALGAVVYRTDENGTVIVSVDAAGNLHSTAERIAETAEENRVEQAA
ncbi:MAG: MBL fold metallo-hydrolase [Ruthenibacterium sp.]